MALDIVTATVPNLIAFDVMAVQSMDNRIGMINYLDYRYSKTKGQTAAGTVFNSSINMLASDPNYSSNFVENEAVGTGDNATTTFQLSWYPIVGTPVVTVAGVATAVTVDAATGKITFATAPATGAAIVATYTFDNESVHTDGPTAAGFTNVPEVELKINSLPIEAKARTLRSFWALSNYN